MESERENSFNSRVSNKYKEPKEISVNITDLVLTPLTCASVVNEIIKCLIYQKSQIPYPYTWLKTAVNRKRNCNQVEDESKPINITAERYYRLVSSAYDALEDLMKNITTEFKCVSNSVQEVLIIFGANAYCPAEVLTIRIPTLASGHIEDNHVYTTSKKQYKILRNIFLSEDWLSATSHSVPSTNMYVMLKKSSTNIFNTFEDTGNDFFILESRYSLPAKVKNTVINLIYDDSNIHNCCDNVFIYEDATDTHTQETDTSKSMQSSTASNCDNVSKLEWYQAKVLLKGFKDCYVNNTSVSDLW